ncbi:MAG TPA: hypothetical protein DDW17_03760 [Deltaproteobacteria bacterium]|nr:hypothetical protein [Deltaproteobacteria bacterium]
MQGGADAQFRRAFYIFFIKKHKAHRRTKQFSVGLTTPADFYRYTREKRHLNGQTGKWQDKAVGAMYISRKKGTYDFHGRRKGY